MIIRFIVDIFMFVIKSFFGSSFDSNYNVRIFVFYRYRLCYGNNISDGVCLLQHDHRVDVFLSLLLVHERATVAGLRA